MAETLETEALPGVRDIVPTYRSVALYLEPIQADREAIRRAIERAANAPGRVVSGRRVDIPVVYGGHGGPDLPEIAAWAGLEPSEVVERHVTVDYRVYMLGFLPGFAYLGTVDERIAAPRLASPRLRVPAGSVGIAGRQTGVYPRESPGGWRLIGRTAMAMFDPLRARAALLRAGDTVRFHHARDRDLVEAPQSSAAGADSRPSSASRTVTVIQPGLLTTVQDAGRWGSQASGVGVSGALDGHSHALANAVVGNRSDAATLEVTIAGPELRLDQDGVLAVTGADLQPTIDGARVRLGVPVSCRTGSIVRFGERRSGARAYVAFDGGVDLAPVLGSRATHVSAGLGGMNGRPLRAGDRVPLGSNRDARQALKARAMTPLLDGARLRVVLGPQDDFFTSEAIDRLESTRFEVTPRSNRMGYRLSGGALPRVPDREMISDATFIGGIQVPPSGEPILLMHDRQTTGGYPQIATVISADLPMAGQLAPGDWVEFRRCSVAEALAALAEQDATRGGV